MNSPAADPRTSRCDGSKECPAAAHLQGCHASRAEPRRSAILSTANELINGQRATDYGDAAENFQRIAELVTPILTKKLKDGEKVDAHEVALILVQLKVARLITSPAHSDSWIDACGYLALGGEIAQRER